MCYAEVLYPVFDLILTFHSNLTTIRHNSLREAASHEILPLCLDLLSHPPTNARSARRFPRRAITIDLVYFLLRAWREALLVCVRTGRGAEPHAPVTMYWKPQLSAAVIARTATIVVIGVRRRMVKLLDWI